LEEPETVILTLATNAAYNVGESNTAVIVIQDNERPNRSSVGPDTDGDGLSDSDEGLAGTDPVDPQSVLRIVSLTGTADGYVTITWTSVPGKIYHVTCKDSASDPYWSDLSGPIIASSTSTSWTDEVWRPGAQRIYCILVS